MKKRIAVWMLLTLLVPLWCGTAAAFSDVPESHWASAEIRYVVERGLFNGQSETIFAPSDGMTRGQMCAVLYRYAGSPVVSGTLSYEDVQPGRYYYDAILWARENSILTESKLSARFLRPDETITRAEFALMLYQFNLCEGGSAFDSAAVSESKMTDMDLCGGAVRNAMLGWAYPAGVLRGTSETTMNPNGTLTRAHVAAMLFRYDTSVRASTAVPVVPSFANAEPPAAYGTDNNNSTVPTGYQIVADIPSSMEVRSRRAVTPKTNPVQERCAWSVASSNEAVLGVEKSGDGNTLLVARSAGTAVVTVTNTADGVLSCNGEKKRPNTLRRRLICDKRASADGKAVKSSDFKRKPDISAQSKEVCNIAKRGGVRVSVQRRTGTRGRPSRESAHGQRGSMIFVTVGCRGLARPTQGVANVAAS